MMLVIMVLANLGMAQNAVVKGVVYDNFGDPIENAVIRGTDFDQQTISDAYGHFSISVPSNRNIQLFVQALCCGDTLVSFHLQPRETVNTEIRMSIKGDVVDEVVITGQKTSLGYVQVNPKLTFQLPSPTGGMESLIKMLPGTTSNNELSSQYNVRGGNFDENLVFVNGIQIYRPFLVRNAQQEGLSFINSDLTGNVMFSAGAFDAKYGDKMSSVLDVTYKEPTRIGGSFSASLLGATAHAEGKVKNFSYLIGIRYKTNAYLLKSMETSGNYKPRFFDTQFC